MSASYKNRAQWQRSHSHAASHARGVSQPDFLRCLATVPQAPERLLAVVHPQQYQHCVWQGIRDSDLLYDTA